MEKIVSLVQVIKELWSIEKQQKVKNMVANHFCPKFRCIVETCLVSACHTIHGDTRSFTVRDHDIIAPMILQGSPLDSELIVKFHGNNEDTCKFSDP